MWFCFLLGAPGEQAEEEEDDTEVWKTTLDKIFY